MAAAVDPALLPTEAEAKGTTPDRELPVAKPINTHTSKAKVQPPSPISTMRSILANVPGLWMPAKALKEALASAGFPDTPQSTVNATLAGWTGDLRALQAAGALAVPFATIKAS
jgi:hypothetical protein